MAQSLFDQLGGEPKLRAVIDDFVERLFADPMIGFFFRKSSKERIKAKEYEFAAGHLGAKVTYTGRPLPHAHSAHPINGGHFMRRMQLLRETLEAHGAPGAVLEHWLEHTEQMRPFITQQAGSACNDDMTSKTPTQSSTQSPPPSPAVAPSSEGVAMPASGAPPSNPKEPPSNPKELQSNPKELQSNPKEMPSIDEINAYLERSSANTKKRLPLAFNAPETQPVAAQPTAERAPDPNPPKANLSRALPLVKAPKS